MTTQRPQIVSHTTLASACMTWLSSLCFLFPLRVNVTRATTWDATRHARMLTFRELCAGPDPVRAVRDIQRLCMFPIVFSVGPVMASALGDSYGGPSSTVMSEAASLMQHHIEQVPLSNCKLPPTPSNSISASLYRYVGLHTMWS